MPDPTALLPTRPLGRTGLRVPSLGYGTFKLGRNRGIKYPAGYELPDDARSAALLHEVIGLGYTLIDTAPAYGLAEARVGAALHDRRHAVVLCTKVGETFDPQTAASSYDFSADAVRASVQRSLARLRTDVLDLVLIHADGRDGALMRSDAPGVLSDLKAEGLVRAVGFSGKSAAGNRAALADGWADVLMVEYHAAMPEAERDAASALLHDAHAAGVGTLVKKGLASGHLPAADAIRFVLEHPGVDALVVAGLNAEHLRANAVIAGRGRADSTRETGDASRRG